MEIERISIVVNSAKAELGKLSFNKETFMKMSDNVLPVNNRFWQYFKKAFLNTESKDTFTFKSTAPIYYKQLEEVYRQYRADASRYNTTSRNKMVSTKEVELPTLEAAINLLKQNGYKIMKPTFIEI